MKVKETKQERSFSIEDLSEYQAGVLMMLLGKIVDKTDKSGQVLYSIYSELYDLGVVDRGVFSNNESGIVMTDDGEMDHEG